MAHPMVVHCKKDRYDVYVGRPSKWGNPFPIQCEVDRTGVIEKYRFWLENSPRLKECIKAELRGKILGCWCAPRTCHAEVLAEIANS